MNWQSVKAAPGQFIKLQVIITDIKHMNGQSGMGPYALGKAMDGPGQVESVLITVKQGDQFPTDLAVNHRLNGAGKFDANTGKTKFYFDSYAQDQAPPPNSYPPAGQQVAQQPAPIAQQVAQQAINMDPKGLSIERQVAWKEAREALASKTYPNLADLISDMTKLASAGAKFMADGKDIPTMGQDDAPPPGDADVPWDN